MGFEFGWLKNVLPKAMVLGLLIAGLFVILFEPRQGADTVPSIAKQSYDYWTGGAQPFSISRQSQSAGDKVWIVELANNENDSIEFYGVCAIGEGGIVNWTFNDSSRFGPNESKVLLIPAPKTCQNNRSYTYSLNITYAYHAGDAKEVEVGKYPIFGQCG